MAERRMFAKSVINSARFLMMPVSSRLLYYDLGMSADDDGIVEAFSVLRLTGAAEDDLRVLCSKGYITILNDELVSFINDWKRNNLIRSDRYQPSIYKNLLVKIAQEDSENNGLPMVNQRETEDRIGEDSLGEFRLGEDRENATAPPLSEEERQELLTKGISEVYINERLQRAGVYASQHQKTVFDVLCTWWKEDKNKHSNHERTTKTGDLGNSFDTDDTIVYSVDGISLSIVPGIPMQGIPLSERSLAPLNEPSPPMTTSPSIPLTLQFLIASCIPSSVVKRRQRAVYNTVPPRWIISDTERISRSTMLFSISPL